MKNTKEIMFEGLLKMKMFSVSWWYQTWYSEEEYKKKGYNG